MLSAFRAACCCAGKLLMSAALVALGLSTTLACIWPEGESNQAHVTGRSDALFTFHERPHSDLQMRIQARLLVTTPGSCMFLTAHPLLTHVAFVFTQLI